MYVTYNTGVKWVPQLCCRLSLRAVLPPPKLPVDPLSVAEGAWANCLALESFIPSCHLELRLNVSEAIMQNSETPFLPEAKLKPVSWTVGPAGSRRD